LRVIRNGRIRQIILGESDPEGCGACLSAQNGYRNGPLYGASVTEATMRTYELARKYGLTVQGAVTWAFEFEDQPAFASLRALATNGIDKPVLNAFRLMGKLSGEWIETESDGALPLEDVVTHSVTGNADVNAVATRHGKEVDVLVWNYHDADVAAPDAQVQLEVDGLQGAECVGVGVSHGRDAQQRLSRVAADGQSGAAECGAVEAATERRATGRDGARQERRCDRRQSGH
jgi:hypothetical protein